MAESVRMIPAICPQCTASLMLDAANEFAYCQYCGTKILVANAAVDQSVYNTVYNTNIENKNQVKVGPKGMVESLTDMMVEKHRFKSEEARKAEEAARRREERERLAREEAQRQKDAETQRRQQEAERQRIQEERNTAAVKRHWRSITAASMGFIMLLALANSLNIHGFFPVMIIFLLLSAFCYAAIIGIEAKIKAYDAADDKYGLLKEDVHRMGSGISAIFRFVSRYWKILLAVLFLLVSICIFAYCSRNPAENAAEPTEPPVVDLTVPLSANACEGENVAYILEVFKEAGFTNVNSNAVCDLLMADKSREYLTESVTIEGSSFPGDGVFPSDAKIVVTYHCMNKVSVPFDLSEMKAPQLDEILWLLENAGFMNIRTEATGDNIYTLFAHYEDGQVWDVSIGAETDFEKYDTFIADIPVVVRYYSAPETEETQPSETTPTAP